MEGNGGTGRGPMDVELLAAGIFDEKVIGWTRVGQDCEGKRKMDLTGQAGFSVRFDNHIFFATVGAKIVENAFETPEVVWYFRKAELAELLTGSGCCVPITVRSATVWFVRASVLALSLNFAKRICCPRRLSSTASDSTSAPV